VFLGDDLTDENGFRAAERLGGFGVVVGPRRPTAATYALAGVAAVRAWLTAAMDTPA
jgi:trehalose 6-phosphate phosphatase